jgi:LCP family protein required for cell wall assembly
MTRSPRRRALVLLVIAPVTLGLVVAGSLATAWLALGAPTPASGAVWLQVSKVAASQYTGAPDQPFFVLVAGTGARSDDPSEATDDPGLADSLHVIGINPAMHAASILDIPRDTEGPGGSKINSYIVGGDQTNFGLRAEADAVSSVVGVPITYVVRANFPNFVQMVDGIGGIDINVPTDMNDDFSGANFAAGPQHLDGDQALAFSRDRHSMPRGDLDRSSNQGLLLLAALATLEARHPSIGDTVHLVALAGQHVKLDGLGVRDLLALGQFALSLDPASVKNVLLPVGSSGDGTNLVKTPDAASVLADFADDGVMQSS